MTAKLNILIIEDNPADADLLLRELKKSGLNFIAEIVQTRLSFEKALTDFKPDIILSDYSLPAFDAVTAFRIKQNKAPHVPFIIVSGIIGEENAVELIKDGVTDYASKNKLFAISTKINRALNDSAMRSEKKNTDEKLKKQTAELIIANDELIFQNNEKEKRAADLVELSISLKSQQQELKKANQALTLQEEKVKSINRELSQLNQQLEERVNNRTKALSESEFRFRNMMETIPQIAWTNTMDGKVIYYNQRWYDYTGLNPHINLSNGFSGIIHPDDLLYTLKQFSTIRKSHKGGEFQIRGKRADGLYRWHLIRLMPINDEAGQMQLWVGTATDIQELRVLQQQKDDFISIASHELKTPITSLKAALQLLDRLKNKPTSPMLPKLIEQANKSMGKVILLIEDLLNTGMVSNGKLEINPQELVLAELIDDCCQDIRKQGSYELNLTGDLNLKVYADATRIEQIIINFVNNAIKYAPNSKAIEISIENLKNTVKVTVTDEGPGITPEKLPYLFDRYYRVENNGSQYTGLGLGLYICAEIIRKHHGQIGVDSTLGKGSSFWFTLPIASVVDL